MKTGREKFTLIGLTVMLIISLTVITLLCGGALRKEREAAGLTRAVLLCSSASEAFYGGKDLGEQLTLLAEIADFRGPRPEKLPAIAESEPIEGVRLEIILDEEADFYTARIRAVDAAGTELYALSCLRSKKGGQ